MSLPSCVWISTHDAGGLSELYRQRVESTPLAPLFRKAFFDADAMRRYQPDYVPVQEYMRLLETNRARRALIALTGVASPRLNQANSFSASPLKNAFTGDPVRISPGTTVVTETPSAATSARSPSEKPSAANFAAS